MTQYYDSSDKRHGAAYQEHTPDILQAFTAFNSAVFAPEGRSIPLKYRELIGIGVAISTQCPYCIDAHTAAAQRAGATEQEITEVAWVAAALNAGAGVTHGRLALKLAEEHRGH